MADYLPGSTKGDGKCELLSSRGKLIFQNNGNKDRYHYLQDDSPSGEFSIFILQVTEKKAICSFEEMTLLGVANIWNSSPIK
ncbi:hypothetical protein [Aquitalea palustris]|uniref:hypothetical protein n=1 Tax=Aquitalea palustris TaxID=2480983 RepID=UPI0011C37790|nr:hypothetical protein [Aquitalea palustris]